jgi:DNA-binding NtrC family response regulator
MRGRILIVDDDAGVRALYARALQLDGHATQLADSAQQAMQLVHDAPPDGILLDLRMPFISGVGFLYRLREIHPRLPVAIVTGMGDVDEATQEEIRTLGDASPQAAADGRRPVDRASVADARRDAMSADWQIVPLFFDHPSRLA